jgi:putative transposase
MGVEATSMKKNVENKIHAAVKRQARRIARYDLLQIGKNALYELFAVLFIVIEAAAASSSIELKAKGPDADTVFYHLHKLRVESIEKMLKNFVKRHTALLKRRFGNRKFAVAIDFTEEMYYGEKGNPAVVGTKYKNGSNLAYRFLTVNIVVAGMRFFLFAYPVFERGNNRFYVEKVLNLLKEFDIRIYVLLLDREFNDAATIDLLNERGCPYVIPADHDSRFKRWAKAVGKYPAIARWWGIGEGGVETTLVILEEEGHLYGYFTNLPESFYRDDAYILSFLYSKRWGIETAHKVDDKFRIYTTSKDGVIRYFFFVISVLLYNLWVWINLAFGLEGNSAIRVDELKEILCDIFDEFLRWLSSPERWFSFGLMDAFGARGFLLQKVLFL